MAPEQLVGEAVDGRSDLFSLGVILYVMVTGHSPFHGNSATTVCFKVVNREPVPASAFDLDIPRALDAVISRAVAKDPNERYQRGADFARDLRQLRLEHTGSTTGFLVSRILMDTESLRPRPATATTNAEGGFEYAGRVGRTLLHRVSPRDLILGSAVIAVLLLANNAWRRNVASQDNALEKISAPAPMAPAVIAPPELPKPANSTSAGTKSSAHSRSKTLVRSKPTQELSTSPVKEPATTVPTSTVELAIQHQFKEATLSVWVDDQLALTLPLHGGTQKRLVVFRGLHGAGSETLRVPAGNHALRLKAQSSDQSIDLSKTISANFAGGDDKTLQITFDKRNTTMFLNWH
jgi:serine/threonine protein kinase